jgi:hypothetical protein
MQGCSDGAICNDKYTPQYDAGFTIGGHDKQAGLLNKDVDDQYIIPQNKDKLGLDFTTVLSIQAFLLNQSKVE